MAAAAQAVRLYQDAGYRGGTRTFTRSLREFAGQRWDNGQNLDNSASSVQNATGSYLRLYDVGTSCTGSVLVLKPAAQEPRLGREDTTSCLQIG